MTAAYLTIDDAPSSELPAKLELLRERDVPALFFCEGRRLADHADHARQAVEAGYHLGNHAYSHTHASELSVDDFREEVRRTEETIDSVYDDAGFDRPARVFRFPYGDRGDDWGEDPDDDHVEALQSVLADLGFQPIDRDVLGTARYRADDVAWAADGLDWGWTVDVRDWDCETAADLRVQLDLAADRLDDPGDEVVLFHDDGTDLALYETLIEYLRGAGVSFGDPLDVVAE